MLYPIVKSIVSLWVTITTVGAEIYTHENYTLLVSDTYIELTADLYPRVDECCGTNFRCFAELYTASYERRENGFPSAMIYIDPEGKADWLFLAKSPDSDIELSFSDEDCEQYCADIFNTINKEFNDTFDYCFIKGDNRLTWSVISIDRDEFFAVFEPM